MKYINSKKLKYLIYMISVIVLIFTAFDIYITFRIHDELGKMVSKPSRWPVGAYVYDKKIGFDFAPNISDYIQDNSFYVKSHQLGYRIAKYEDAITNQPGGILSLGCSLTYGDEVDSEQAFTQIIADSLFIPAYNYGVCSFSYIHALLKAQELADQGVVEKLQPKYVILGCWRGLLNRSRTPFPPIAAKNIPLTAAYIKAGEEGPYIEYPLSSRHIFELATMYRKEGADLSLKKFVKIFMAVPRFVYVLLKNNKLLKGGRKFNPDNKVSDYDVYDFYFTGIENIFSSSNTQVIVLYMPSRENDNPDKALIKAMTNHPDIILINGLEAAKKYNIPVSDYKGIHPRPAAHRAYALETIDLIN